MKRKSIKRLFLFKPYVNVIKSMDYSEDYKKSLHYSLRLIKLKTFLEIKSFKIPVLRQKRLIPSKNKLKKRKKLFELQIQS